MLRRVSAAKKKMTHNSVAIEHLKEWLLEQALKKSTSNRMSGFLYEAYEVIQQLQAAQRWRNPKKRLPDPYIGVLAIVSGKPHPNITLDRVYCIAEYIPDEGWIVSEYPECTDLEILAWMPLPPAPELTKQEE